jgi:hypothetical protein
VTYSITHHSGFGAPGDALDLLWQRLGGYRGEARFVRVGTGIKAMWGDEGQSWLGRYEREEIGRRAVLDIVCDICVQAPELDSDWYAVSPLR